MNIVEKNQGEKTPYSVEGTRLNINDELILDLSRYERDFDVHIDISEDWAGMLVMGLGDRYVAQIDMPARKYNEIEVENDEGTEGEGESTTLEPVPFSMENVTLTLWALKEGGLR
ncbi:hypothetical protein [Clostridium formicaceticum]|uniref:Uncharacterized protein n=1 Tax=Clostridium formicaceticum TaxID=1497 RepID=A0AAC9WG82_9CLOT|nr:hypothetical protein [Clostridium formicaceticum]AOY77180.1 hypothetical protein BJL90_15790 [Clostridium formicaceticum]ARE87702.1 hypothetical protein CLFO_21020 [Clostridium formicaceticum]